MDGCQFINEAISRGASAIVYAGDAKLTLQVPSFRVKNEYLALSRMAEFHFDYPSRDMELIGVTGTNGKSTTTTLLKYLLNNTHYNVGLIGTINYEYCDVVIQATRTTPPALELQNLIATMKTAGVNLIIMEVSSHALSQYRLGSMKFDMAVFTNLSEEHLDYHKTIKGYYNSKKKLFTDHIKDRGKIFINIDDSYGRKLSKDIQANEQIIYGYAATSQNKIVSFSSSLKSSTIKISAAKSEIVSNCSLIGKYNSYNIAAAVSIALRLGISTDHIQNQLNQFPGVPGRLERLTESSKINIFIDYAHTEDALRNVLQTIKPLCNNNNLIVVFGCGGNRDKSKRAKMGKVVSEFANDIIITNDNPRNEDPNQIIREIIQGIPPETTYKVIMDRQCAIEAAIRDANEGDTIIIAGKGHEDFQEINNDKIQFSDTAVAKNAALTGV